MYQRGIHNVVASSGTALTSDQIQINLIAYKEYYGLCLMANAAGLRASLRGIDLIFGAGNECEKSVLSQKGEVTRIVFFQTMTMRM